MPLPTAQELRDLLAAMRESGATRVRVGAIEAHFPAPEVGTVSHERKASTEESPLVDEDGNPVDLDEGMPPELTQDPIARANLRKAS